MVTKTNKYEYTIKSMNGVIVKNLVVNGIDESAADKKIYQLYRHCEIISRERVWSKQRSIANYEDILNSIADSNE